MGGPDFCGFASLRFCGVGLLSATPGWTAPLTPFPTATSATNPKYC